MFSETLCQHVMFLFLFFCILGRSFETTTYETSVYKNAFYAA